MKIEGNGQLLRIFIGEQDRLHGQSLYEVILNRVREMGLAGCTVLRGLEGFGANSRTVHTARLLRLSEDLPIVIEIADSFERISKAMQELDKIITDADCGVLMTLEKIEIVRYRPAKEKE
jgi:PII-like signaling protein